MCACILDSSRNATARLAGRGAWGYTSAGAGRSRLNLRWGAGRPPSVECHPPAQVTRFGTLGTGADQGPASLASVGVCIPTITLDLGVEPPAHLPYVITHVMGKAVVCAPLVSTWLSRPRTKRWCRTRAGTSVPR